MLIRTSKLNKKNWTKIHYIKVSREGFTGVFVEWSERKLYYTLKKRNNSQKARSFLYTQINLADT